MLRRRVQPNVIAGDLQRLNQVVHHLPPVTVHLLDQDDQSRATGHPPPVERQLGGGRAADNVGELGELLGGLGRLRDGDVGFWLSVLGGVSPGAVLQDAAGGLEGQRRGLDDGER